LNVKLVNPLKPINMAATCPNCKVKLSCGCQTRKASNGTSVCTNCIGRYEATLRAMKPKVIAPQEAGNNK
jgi:hypothetical protein